MPAKPVVGKTLRLSPELNDASEDAARKAGLNWTEWTVKAIEAYLKKGGR